MVGGWVLVVVVRLFVRLPSLRFRSQIRIAYLRFILVHLMYSTVSCRVSICVMPYRTVLLGSNCVAQFLAIACEGVDVNTLALSQGVPSLIVLW